MSEPTHKGTAFKMKDGRTLHVIIVHRPGNGYGVSVSEFSYKEFYSCDLPTKAARWQGTKYYPWHKFKKLIDHEVL